VEGELLLEAPGAAQPLGEAATLALPHLEGLLLHQLVVPGTLPSTW
jgi:hypothetical protein